MQDTRRLFSEMGACRSEHKEKSTAASFLIGNGKET